MSEVYETLPIVPLRDVVVFPHMMMPFVIGRPSSTRALEHALLKDKRIFLAAQQRSTHAKHFVIRVWRDDNGFHKYFPMLTPNSGSVIRRDIAPTPHFTTAPALECNNTLPGSMLSGASITISVFQTFTSLPPTNKCAPT